MREITPIVSIGNANDGRTHGPDFTHVVSLAAANDATTHAHPITDGEHDYTEFKHAADAVSDSITNNDPVLVHCNAGLSRSVAVAIAALVVADDWDYDDAYDACRSGFIYPAPELINSAKQYIDTHTD